MNIIHFSTVGIPEVPIGAALNTFCCVLVLQENELKPNEVNTLPSKNLDNTVEYL
jgi:hypothetical protein